MQQRDMKMTLQPCQSMIEMAKQWCEEPVKKSARVLSKGSHRAELCKYPRSRERVEEKVRRLSKSEKTDTQRSVGAQHERNKNEPKIEYLCEASEALRRE
jgi:hypothetical protein